MSGVTVVALDRTHWPDVERIYVAGIATGHATFETDPPTWDKFDADKLPGQRFVALDGDAAVLGWAAAYRVSARTAYAGVVEHSLYVDAAARGRGVGRTLLDELLASAERSGIWTVQSGVFPENTASLALHEAAGFRVVGTRERIARMTYGPLAGRWRDVVLLEKRLQVST
ncbi:N-acetyltransferase family protein [Cellulomonas sp. URHB0016]